MGVAIAAAAVAAEAGAAATATATRTWMKRVTLDLSKLHLLCDDLLAIMATPVVLLLSVRLSSFYPWP